MFGRVYAPREQSYVRGDEYISHPTEDAALNGDITRRPRRRTARRAYPTAEEVQAYIDANPVLGDLVALAAQGPLQNGFLRDLLNKVVQYGSLSDKQLSAARDTMDRDIQYRAERAADAANAADVPTGRIEVIGEVLSIKDKGWGPKMIVKHADGWKVWGSVPSSLTEYVPGRINISHPNGINPGQDEATVAVGDTVKFTATIKASDDDPKFGFFKRPSNAEVIA